MWVSSLYLGGGAEEPGDQDPFLNSGAHHGYQLNTMWVSSLYLGGGAEEPGDQNPFPNSGTHHGY